MLRYEEEDCKLSDHECAMCLAQTSLWGIFDTDADGNDPSTLDTRQKDDELEPAAGFIHD